MQMGAKPEDIEELSKRSAVNVSVDSNPRKVTEKDFAKIFEMAIAAG